MSAFAEIAHAARVDAGFTLSTLSRALVVPAGILSKIERGVDPAPSDKALLSAWALLLGLEEGDRERFMQAAAISAAQGPGPMPTEADVDAHMPLFIRDVPASKVATLRIGVRQVLTPTALMARP